MPSMAWHTAGYGQRHSVTLAYVLWSVLQLLNLGDWHVCRHCGHEGLRGSGSWPGCPTGHHLQGDVSCLHLHSEGI